MGFLDKVKGLGKEMGIGLSGQEQYQRAYEKGVLLQPPDYSAAAKNFAAAGEKFLKEGNDGMARLSHANAALYELVNGRDLSAIPEVIQALEPMGEVPRIGSQDEMVQTAPLIAELTALLYERQAEASDSSADKTTEYTKAADVLMKLGNSTLEIAERLNLKGPVDQGMMRAFYCMALSDYHSALAVVMTSPTQAHDLLQKSAAEFRQALATDWSETVDGYIAQVSSKSHCWMCGREMQGRDLFYMYYPASTEEFHQRLLENSNEDLRMIDRAGHVTICTICGSSIENQADRYATMRADEVREWATQVLQAHEEVLKNHNDRLHSLERAAHTH